MKRIFLLSVVVLFLFSCSSSDQPVNKFSDPILLKIADYQDRRMPDSLYPYFNHKNSLYRRDAVQAFGSVQDSAAVDRIGKLLLMDSDTAVRKAAAFAMGQLHHSHSERILLGALVKEKNAGVVREILESYGKTTKRWQLDRPALLEDSTKIAGLAWSLYRAGLRDKTDSVANRVGGMLLDKRYNSVVRAGAAYYFSRGAKHFESAEKELINAALKDPSADVRMAAALSLGKIPSGSSLEALKNILKSETDPGVIINAIRALRAFPFGQVKHHLYDALGRKDINAGIAASEVIMEIIIPEAWIEVSTLTNRVSNWRIRANLYEAALKAGKNPDLAKEIMSACESLVNPYHRAAMLGALKSFPAAYPFVETELRKADTAAVRSASASTLVAMRYSENFPATLKSRFAEIFKDLMQSDDPAVAGIISGALADSTLGFRKMFSGHSFLYDARKGLKLPEDNEALQSIEAAIAHFEGRAVPSPVKNEFNHPIDWELVKTIPGNQLATIQTTRGSIIIRLLVNDSPGSVANFIALARRNYFDDKYVHRVVPNFVIQAGCRRGDGWGSEDYSIRSEFSPRRYQAGSVGMASAGKDTEGTQWFITHSPTPHLDGRYTLFAEVVKGMNVVHSLQVGDKILDVVLESSPAR